MIELCARSIEEQNVLFPDSSRRHLQAVCSQTANATMTAKYDSGSRTMEYIVGRWSDSPLSFSLLWPMGTLLSPSSPVAYSELQAVSQGIVHIILPNKVSWGMNWSRICAKARSMHVLLPVACSAFYQCLSRSDVVCMNTCTSGPRGIRCQRQWSDDV